MRKMLTAILAATLMMGCGSIATQNKPVLSTEKETAEIPLTMKDSTIEELEETEELSWQEKLDEIRDSIVCLKNMAIYKNPPEVHLRIFLGTGFAYKTDEEGRTYFATCQHVIQSPQKYTSKSSGRMLELSGEEIFIRDGNSEYNPNQDTRLELVAEKKGSVDTAVIRTRDKDYSIDISNGYKIDPDLGLASGEEAYLVGCQYGTVKAVTQGIISGKTENDNLLVSVVSHGGVSGGPIFVRRGNDIYLVAQVKAGPNAGDSDFAISTPIEKLLDIWEIESTVEK